MSNNVGKGAVVLVVSGLICKFFGAFFRLPLTNILGIQGIAVYQMVMTIYSLALVFATGGVTNALSRLVSSARARGDFKAIGAYLRHAFLFTIGVSCGFALVFFILSPQIASLQGIKEGVMSYRGLALLLPLGALVGVCRGTIQGYGNMTPTAISQIIEQVVKFAFGLIFAYLFRQQGVEGGVFGAILGIVISELFALLYLGFRLTRKSHIRWYVGYKKEFYSASLPLTFGGVILPLTHAVESLFIVKLLVSSGLEVDVAASIYGIQTGVVGAILNFPLIISVSVASALLPNLSFLVERKDFDGQRSLISKAMHIMWFLLIPLVFGLVAISGRLYPFIYPSAMRGFEEIAVQLTYVNGFSIICTAIMQLLVSILQANGFFKDSLIFYAIGGAAKLGVLFVVGRIAEVSVFAIAISSIVLATIVSICVIVKLKRIITLRAFEIVLPLLSSVVMFMVVSILLSLVPSIFGLILSVVAGMTVYFVLCMPLTAKYTSIVFSRVKKKE